MLSTKKEAKILSRRDRISAITIDLADLSDGRDDQHTAEFGLQLGSNRLTRELRWSKGRKCSLINCEMRFGWVAIYGEAGASLIGRK